MQDVAREMNLSETAFLHPADDGYALRWFTPAVEVELCGHATLASAHVSARERRVTAQLHLDGRCEPAQRVPVVGGMQERRLRQVHFARHVLHPVLDRKSVV